MQYILDPKFGSHERKAIMIVRAEIPAAPLKVSVKLNCTRVMDLLIIARRELMANQMDTSN